VYLLTFKTDFAAAHQLRGYRGKCENLHGHNFKVEVVVRGEELDRCGMLVDFVELKAAVNRCLEALDHRNLNDLPYFATTVNPSAENISRYVYEEVAKALPAQAAVDHVTVYETDRCAATYRLS
jgi:6-pyruvoyltetrahydropterin/6-carboxytetrahydropterin synthase